MTGQALTFEIPEAEAALRVELWIRDLASLLGAEVLVTDDADGLKTVADHLGLQSQICRAPVRRSVHELIANLGTKAMEHPDPVPRELSDSVTVDQFLEDMGDLEWIIKSVPANGQALMPESNRSGIRL